MQMTRTQTKYHPSVRHTDGAPDVILDYNCCYSAVLTARMAE